MIKLEHRSTVGGALRLVAPDVSVGPVPAKTITEQLGYEAKRVHQTNKYSNRLIGARNKGKCHYPSSVPPIPKFCYYFYEWDGTKDG